ncbi:MAG TPA: hypothetical protein VG994_20985 [Steroidobacteraceae bacterium]|nr:hypothetical protein [Steroidobacteraceae bacterium]
MLGVYAAWVEGARECDIAAIRRAMGYDREIPTPSNRDGCRVGVSADRTHRTRGDRQFPHGSRYEAQSTDDPSSLGCVSASDRGFKRRNAGSARTGTDPGTQTQKPYWQKIRQ